MTWARRAHAQVFVPWTLLHTPEQQSWFLLQVVVGAPGDVAFEAQQRPDRQIVVPPVQQSAAVVQVFWVEGVTFSGTQQFPVPAVPQPPLQHDWFDPQPVPSERQHVFVRHIRPVTFVQHREPAAQLPWAALQAPHTLSLPQTPLAQ
jgi:hypothetical protein